AIRLTSLLYRLRIAVYAVAIAVTLALGAGLIYTISRVVGSLSSETAAKSIEQPATTDVNANPVSPDKAVQAIGSEAGLPLDKVWQVEKTGNYELYSNSARILTQFETAGAERKFYRFELDKGNPDSSKAELLTKPVGIIYHISESDLL